MFLDGVGPQPEQNKFPPRHPKYTFLGGLSVHYSFAFGSFSVHIIIGHVTGLLLKIRLINLVVEAVVNVVRVIDNVVHLGKFVKTLDFLEPRPKTGQTINS